MDSKVWTLTIVLSAIDAVAIYSIFPEVIDISAPNFTAALLGAVLWNVITLGIALAADAVGFAGGRITTLLRLTLIPTFALLIASGLTDFTLHVGGPGAALAAAMLNIPLTIGVSVVLSRVCELLTKK